MHYDFNIEQEYIEEDSKKEQNLFNAIEKFDAIYFIKILNQRIND